MRDTAKTGSARSATAAAMIVALLTPCLPARGGMRSGTGGGAASKLSEAQRETLVLSRFTFGPQAGDLAEIRAEGIDRWFERQLTPSRIDDSALDRRLEQFPALRMTESERAGRYPEPGLVRRMVKQGAALPADPEVLAILTHQVEFDQLRREQKSVAAQAGKAAQGPDGTARSQGSPAANGPMMDGSAGSMARDPAGPASGTAAASIMAGLAEKPMPPLNAGAATLRSSKPSVPPPGEQPMAKERVDSLLSFPAAARYKAILDLSSEDLIALRKATRGREDRLTDGMTPLQMETLRALAGTNGMLLGEVDGSRLLRDVYSRRQVEAVMTDFWLNHFNVYDRKDGDMPSLLPSYEAAVRTHALGRFEDLLIAVARSPAMMLYLDNASSVGPDSPAAQGGRKRTGGGTNENYARELMELHTLGVEGGYTQRDVSEVAKVFTGWTLAGPGNEGGFIYNDRRHEPGPKLVLGQRIEGRGEQEGFEVLHMLATSPATARFVSRKLAERFVSDIPPEALVNRLAKTFLASNGDIAKVLRTLSRSPEFNAPATVHAKLKTPLEYVTSAVRVSGAETTDPAALVQSLARLGMPLYGAPVPTGYRWDSETWLSTSALIDRMNFALAFSANKIKGTTVTWPEPSRAFSQGAISDLEPTNERMLERLLLSEEPSPQTRAAVLAQTSGLASLGGKAGPPGRGYLASASAPLSSLSSPPKRADAKGSIERSAEQGRVSAMAGLLLGSPEFQRR